MNPRARHASALAILGASTAVSGAGFVLSKASVLAQLPFAAGESSWFISAHNLAPRFLLGALALVAFYRRRVLRLTRAEWTQALFLALASFAGCMLQTDGLQRTSAATTCFLTQFYVILIPLGWAFVHRKRPTVTVLLACLLVLAGVSVLAHIDWRTFRIGRGEGEILLATIFFSLMLGSINWPGFAANRADATSTMMFLLEGVLFAGLSIATCRDSAHLFAPYTSLGWLALVVATTLFLTAGPFVLINRWQRFIPPTEAGLIYSVGPVLTALTEAVLPVVLATWIGIAYANQPLTSTLVTGGALILGANLLIQLWPQEK